VLEHTEERILATFSRGEAPPSHARLRWLRTDVRDSAALSALNGELEAGTKAIYLAACHQPDMVEEQPELAWSINITALADAVNRLGRVACLYYASTDSVYGEGARDRKFKEGDACAPLNRYGVHKALAEQIVLAAGFNVVRFPFLFGPSLAQGRPHFFDHIRAELEAGKPVEMFADSYRSTLSFDQCARYLVLLMERYGPCPAKVLNIASDEPLSKYGAALALAERFGLDTSLVKGIPFRESAVFKVRRAQSTVMDNARLKELLGLDHISLEL
jgi:dTDP-4-dehydrorhamnose reductase